ncbi:probable LRR receptor-like serine/threonine-protein kinase At3g47570 isoform X2 [Macadamia integrifolia]|uniref:probable LRR receptor-like serine/threonine-protein kinase At3g47570 isoform X2 n=1 Tax=Macadamia integrifolia TaxID=60698 RepID=UPI001C4EFCF5|nr:probable LRR receptor-like serine/threonine-protein kinase At3g47570 isoform X2 [Macadamia integrifolia]
MALQPPLMSLSLSCLLLCTSLLWVFGLEPVTSAEGTDTDQLALIEFKRLISGDPSGALSSWNDSLHFCNWKGVTCGRRHQRVSSLDLQAQGLSLLLSNNSFGGEIPTNLTNCYNLREIMISRNNLIGKIPIQFGSLSKLETLSMFANKLNGEIPSSFGNLSSIQAISLAANSLSGSISEFLSRLTSLRTLKLLSNNLSGKFLSSLYNLSSLTTVNIVYNQFQGSFPVDYGLSLPNLNYLAIGGNNFTGTIPDSLSNISTLGLVDLMGNNFVGPIPESLGVLQNLSWLTLGSNYFGAGRANDLNFLTSLTNCSSLGMLDFTFNGFQGQLPNSLANLSTQLTFLAFGNNKFSGTIPAGIENLVRLTVLGLESNLFSGNIPIGIGKLQNLQRLFSNSNRLSGQIPHSICNIPLLYELHLDDNNLTGNIPSCLGNSQHLQLLTLSDNKLQGPIPKELFGISSLTILLNLSHNSLVGSLPLEVGKLGNLAALDISQNRLSGEIPSSIGDCISLEYLYMGGNLFNGTIPQSLTLLKGIQDLDLSHNNLSKQIPKDLENLYALRNLNLSFNNLEGEIPTKGVFGNASEVSVAGNGKLCGGIPDLQLPACTIHGSTEQGKSQAVKLILAIILAVVSSVLISFLLALYWVRKSRSKPPSTPLIGDPHLKISYKELFQATRGFSSANLIGSGSFGFVYKGSINQDEKFVAVKVLNLQNPRAYKSFMAECEALRNIRHRNLVRIVTSCSSLDSKGNDFKALVYEFMPNGSIEDWLHPPIDTHNDARNLSLIQRLNIAIDVASGLDYLHHHCHSSIVHCDLKPSNVLLDNDMIAHVSDFGLARLLLEPNNNSSRNERSSIGIKGSIGYTAPEYGMGGVASIYGDVFSYGILLLEMFTGKRPTDEMFKDDLNLHNFAKIAFPEQLMQILDPIILPKEEKGEEIGAADINNSEGSSHRREKLQHCITSIIGIALQCSTESPTERMDMKDVKRELHLIKCNFIGGGIHQ